MLENVDLATLMVNGKPSHPHMIEILDEDGNVDSTQHFDQGWKAADAFWRLETKQCLIVRSLEWDKENESFEDNTEETREEGENRAKRYTKSGNAPKVVNEKLFPKAIVDSVNAYSTYVGAVAKAGKSEGINDQTRKLAVQKSIEFMFNIGATAEEVNQAFKAYVKAMQKHHEESEVAAK